MFKFEYSIYIIMKKITLLLSFFVAIFSNAQDPNYCQTNALCNPTEYDITNAISSTVTLSYNGNGVCSGTLINNTANDGTPYILTAAHCINENVDWSTVQVRFHYLNREECGDWIEEYLTIPGAELVALNRNWSTDGALLKLSHPIPADWNVYFAGWDSRNILPEAVYSLHHGGGQPMVISNSYDIDMYNQGGYYRLGVNNWEHGGIRPGSSGSSLRNPEDRIVGIASRGGTGCNTNNMTWYGRFSLFYSLGDSISERAKEWLDPLNTGDLYIDGINNQDILLGITERTNRKMIIIPQKKWGTVEFIFPQQGKKQIEIYNITGQLLTKTTIYGKRESIEFNHDNGIYIVRSTSNNNELNTNKFNF